VAEIEEPNAVGVLVNNGSECCETGPQRCPRYAAVGQEALQPIEEIGVYWFCMFVAWGRRPSSP